MSVGAFETVDGEHPTGSAPPRAGTFLRPGEVFGPWRLIEHVADGGFGSVWRAIAVDSVTTDQRVVRIDENAAVKFFAATTDERRRAIEREVALAHRLGGRWTPEYFGADLDSIPQWAAFEFITDATLRDLIRSTGPMSGQSLEVFAEDLWDALAYFRSNGVAHRDLTPVNIHVHARSAKPRVIDWGNAGDAAGAAHTAQLPRSAGYAAPEQVEGRPTGWAADLWSWAAVVCFAATGHPPLPVEGYHERIIVCDQPLDLDGVPPRLLDALDAALRWDPEDRDPDRIAALLPGRRTHVELEAARAREADLDDALAEVHHRIRLRDEHLEELEELVLAYERERCDAALVAQNLTRAEVERDEAAREVTALRSRVAELENELGRLEATVPLVTETAAALRRARRDAVRHDVAYQLLRWRQRRLERTLHRHRRRRHGAVQTVVPTVTAAVLAVGVVAMALVRARWESRLLPMAFTAPPLAGLAVARRLTARSAQWRDQVRAGGAAALVLLPALAPLTLSAGILPSPGLARWVMQAPFPTPPPAEALHLGHGARLVDLDPGDCTAPIAANSFWDVRVVPCANGLAGNADPDSNPG